MARSVLCFLILVLNFHLAKANIACFSTHRQASEKSVSIDSQDPRWTELSRRTIARLNHLLGPYAVKKVNIRVLSEASPFEAGFLPEGISIGVKGTVRPSDFESVMSHEIGHEVFFQHFKIEFDGELDSFQNHWSAARRNQQTSGNNKPVEQIELKADSFQLYQELLGDIFAGYFAQDPQAMPRALNHAFENLPESKRASSLANLPVISELIRLRSLDLAPNDPNLLTPLTIQERFDGRPIHYRMLNRIRTKIWRQVLSHLKPQDFPLFIEAYFSAVSSHRQIESRISLKLFEEINESFWSLLVQNLIQRNLQVVP